MCLHAAGAGAARGPKHAVAHRRRTAPQAVTQPQPSRYVTDHQADSKQTVVQIARLGTEAESDRWQYAGADCPVQFGRAGSSQEYGGLPAACRDGFAGGDIRPLLPIMAPARMTPGGGRR